MKSSVRNRLGILKGTRKWKPPRPPIPLNRMPRPRRMRSRSKSRSALIRSFVRSARWRSNEDTAEVRVLYFYDTFNAGVALRARLVKGDADDSTVKFRPVEAARISRGWEQLEGFKLEADCVGDRVVCSASFSAVQRPRSDRRCRKGKAIHRQAILQRPRALSERVLQRSGRFGKTPRNGPHSRVALEAQAQKLSS